MLSVFTFIFNPSTPVYTKQKQHITSGNAPCTAYRLSNLSSSIIDIYVHIIAFFKVFF